MNVKELERIEDLISKAELESAKSKGIIESIESEWKKKFGTSDVSEIQKHLEELTTQLEKSDERLENLTQKLLDSYDWDKLKEELENGHIQN